MTRVNMHQAKSQLSKLVAAAERGEEVVLMRDGVPIVRMVAYEQPRKKRIPGLLAGKVFLDDSFFDPMPPEELAAWEGGE